jgi:hypothetical protein
MIGQSKRCITRWYNPIANRVVDYVWGLGKSSTRNGINPRRWGASNLCFDMSETRCGSARVALLKVTAAQAFLQIWSNLMSDDRLRPCGQWLDHRVGLRTTRLPVISDMCAMGALSAIRRVMREATQLSGYGIEVIAPPRVDSHQIKGFSALIT